MANNTPHDSAVYAAILVGLHVFAKHNDAIGKEIAAEVDAIFQRTEYQHFTEEERQKVVEEAFDYGWPGHGPAKLDPTLTVTDEVRARYGLCNL